MLILVFLSLALILASLVAAWVSMKDFRDRLDKKTASSLFLVRNTLELEKTLPVMHSDAGLTEFKTINPFIVSYERLLKGNESAYVLFGPANFLKRYHQLDLLELEDYTLKMHVDNIQCFEIDSGFSLKKRPEKIEVLAGVNLKSEEYLFLQTVTNLSDKNTQATVRLLVSSKEPSRRVELARLVEGALRAGFGWGKSAHQSTSEMFKQFRQRSLVPREVKPFEVSTEELAQLLKN